MLQSPAIRAHHEYFEGVPGHPELECGVGSWDKFLYGNHRMVVEAQQPLASRAGADEAGGHEAGGHEAGANNAGAAAGLANAKQPNANRIRLPWRRQDEHPGNVDVIVVSAASGTRVRNVVVTRVDAAAGELIFEPIDGPGTYWFYYLPYAMLGRAHYPQAGYLPYRPTADPEWAAAVTPSMWTDIPELAQATAVRYESASPRDSFAPMNFIATAGEVQALHDSHPGAAFLVFAENRLNPVSMRNAVPAHWAVNGPSGEFRDAAQPGEDYVVQLGLYALADLDGVEVDVAAPAGGRCLNTEGTDRLGKPFTRTLTVPRGSVQALYCVIPIPREAAGTTLESSIRVSASISNAEPDEGCDATPVAVRPPIVPPVTVRPITGRTVSVTLDVAGIDEAAPEILAGGFGDPKYLRRLTWLDSTVAQDRGVVAPYTPVTLDARERELGILGRKVRLAPSGLPSQLSSTFSTNVTETDAAATELLAAPMEFTAGPAWTYSPLDFVVDGPGQISWTCQWTSSQWTSSPDSSGGLGVRLRGVLEADGALSYALRLTAGGMAELEDIALTAVLHTQAVPLAMGLGVPGGRRPDSLDWCWDVANRNQDALWLGSVNAGLQLSLRDGGYERPLNTNFYRQQPLIEPVSWANRQAAPAGGPQHAGDARHGAEAGQEYPGTHVRGGVTLRTTGETARLRAFGGSRTMVAGETLDFDFRLLLTPFKPIEPQRHLANRYFHAPADPAQVRASGATVVNVHHATGPAPYINDPLLRADKLASYVAAAKMHGLKVKVYNTVRELTFHSPELLPMLSLDHEIFSDGPGAGHVWLQEHAGAGYVSAWFAPDVDDISVVTTGESRLQNSYVRGMQELVRETGVEGIYLDDIAYDRHTMLRVRKVLDRNCAAPEIDLHSANQFTARDGFASSANLYLEHLPYIDRLRLGEYFDYNNTTPDYWLVELSGIPFGLMGEMLEGGGNPWRGMVFGMTGRAPRVDNRPLWKFWAESGLAEASMIGHWAATPPVRTNNPAVLATIWFTGDRAVVALASWADHPVAVHLEFDDAACAAFGPAHQGAQSLRNAPFAAPQIDGFQEAKTYDAGSSVTLEPGRGVLLTIGEKND
ncbi:glycoside hydrolase domain-containing protein [Micrococcaceae bacterium Sec5.7]